MLWKVRLEVKVLVLSQYWYPENGVPQRRWTWLSKLLVDQGHEVSVVAPWPSYKKKTTPKSWFGTLRANGISSIETGPVGESIYRSVMVPSGSSLTMRTLSQAISAFFSMMNVLRIGLPSSKGRRPDLVVGTVPALPTALLTWCSARLLRTPYVIDLRDAWPDLLANTKEWNRGVKGTSVREAVLSRGPVQLLTFLTDRLLRKVLSQSSGIIVTAEELQRSLELEYPEKASRGTIITIRNVFPRRNIPIKSSINLEAGSPLNVLYAGTLGRAQNLSNAIEAAEIARSFGVNVSLKFVGEGAGLEKLRTRAAKSEVSIEFVDQLEVSKLKAYYDWADTALVHLTNWAPLERAVPSKTYELMTSRIHISGVAVGEAKELIMRLGAGDVVPPESPLELAKLWQRLYENRSMLQVGSESHNWVVHQQSDVVPRELGALMVKVIEG